MNMVLNPKIESFDPVLTVRFKKTTDVGSVI